MPSANKVQVPTQQSLPGMISPGMAALLRAEKNSTPEGTENLEVALVERPGSRGLPAGVRFSLLAADGLLCVLVLAWRLRQGGPSTVWELLLCVSAIVFGAWLSLLALRFR